MNFIFYGFRDILKVHWKDNAGGYFMEMNKYIDHTLLKQNASEEQIVKLCQEAKEYHFCSVCVNPCYVPLCYEELRGSGVKVCTVIGCLLYTSRCV